MMHYDSTARLANRFYLTIMTVLVIPFGVPLPSLRHAVRSSPATSPQITSSCVSRSQAVC